MHVAVSGYRFYTGDVFPVKHDAEQFVLQFLQDSYGRADRLIHFFFLDR